MANIHGQAIASALGHATTTTTTTTQPRSPFGRGALPDDTVLIWVEKIANGAWRATLAAAGAHVQPSGLTYEDVDQTHAYQGLTRELGLEVIQCVIRSRSPSDILFEAVVKLDADKPRTQSSGPCSTCKGSGQYVGLFAVEDCSTCGGRGRV
ncbi:MAG: hypothetical protein IT428_26300 [Planctomycetaceae bacterium]|nr:hypothetical protein [Planctomycetaceae bacterium]